MVSLLLFTLIVTFAADSSEKPAEPDFVALFNGKDLSGWIGDTTGYVVNDGVVKCDKGNNLYTEKEYSDFVFRFEFKLPPGGNNGLAIRYPGQGDSAYTGMCELQVLDTEHPKYEGLDPRQAIGRHAQPAGLQLPHGAVDRIACAAGRKHLPQLLPAPARFDRCAVRFQLFDDLRRIVAEIVDAGSLALPAMLAVGELDDDHVRGLEHITRDPERGCETVRLDPIA